MNALARAGLALLASWSVLLLGASLAELPSHPLAPDVALLLSFALGAAGLAATRAEQRPRARHPLALAVLGVLAGSGSYRLWLGGTAQIGLALGLSPRPLSPAPASAAALACVLVLGPLFEELLYRERLLPALARVGIPLPLRAVAASALFALPHQTPWALLGTFLVGLALGLCYETSRSLPFCIGLHVGLNLASLSPAADTSEARALLALTCFAAGLALARRRPRSEGHHAVALA